MNTRLSATIPQKAIMILAALLFTCAITALCDTPQRAYAGDLVSSKMETQASTDGNITLASAKQLSFGQSYTGTFDYQADSTKFEDYWFKFKTSDRRSTYAVQLDSLDGTNIRMYFYDHNGKSLSNWANASSSYATTNSRKTAMKADLDKNTWIYVKVAHYNAKRYQQYRITVFEQKTLTADNVTLGQSSMVYDGTAQTPSVTVNYDGKLLTKDTDYTLEYKNNVNAGTATVSVKGAGDNYTGEVTKDFTINPKSVTFTTRLSASTFTYNGSQQKPTLQVFADGREVDYKNDVSIVWPYGLREVGRYTVTVNGKGNYSGNTSATYVILPQATEITNISKIRKGFSTSWNRRTSQVSGYQVQFSTNGQFKSGVKTRTINSNSQSSLTVKKLKAKKKYHVRVRTFATANGEKFYSSWSAKRTVKTR